MIDVHAHYLSKEYLTFLKEHNAELEDGFPLPTYDLNDHKRFMKDSNIDYSLLSLSTPQPYFEGYDKESIQMCRSLNEQMAQIKKDDPKHFGFQAMLPLPNVQASIEEALYALDVLNANGIKLASNSRGLYLGDPLLDPLMEELNNRHTIINIHPHRPEPIKEEVFSAGPVPLFEFLADTTRAILNLVGNGVVSRYPNITWIIPHCGSFLPNIYDRFIGISKVLIPQNMMSDIDIQDSFKHFYYDLSGNPAPKLLDWLLTITTPDHLLYGSDYPFTPNNQIQQNQKDLLEMLEKDHLKEYKEQILTANAKDLFNIE